MGLPKAEIPLALLLFNVGVELGQVAFVLLVILLERSFRVLEVRWPRCVERLPGYAVGTLGAYWTIQRTLLLLERRDEASAPSAGPPRPRSLWPALALAHTEAGRAEGFLAGLHHPVSGLDHVLAMIAVGLWGAQLGAPADLAPARDLPDGHGLRRDARPHRRPAARRRGRHRALRRPARPRRARRVAAAALGGGARRRLFAIFHGHAHGSELPAGASGLSYSIGFVVATGTAARRRHRDRRRSTAGAGAAPCCARPGASWRRRGLYFCGGPSRDSAIPGGGRWRSRRPPCSSARHRRTRIS